jgi:hypothetical protein
MASRTCSMIFGWSVALPWDGTTTLHPAFAAVRRG